MAQLKGDKKSCIYLHSGGKGKGVGTTSRHRGV